MGLTLNSRPQTLSGPFMLYGNHSPFPSPPSLPFLDGYFIPLLSPQTPNTPFSTLSQLVTLFPFHRAPTTTPTCPPAPLVVRTQRPRLCPRHGIPPPWSLRMCFQRLPLFSLHPRPPAHSTPASSQLAYKDAAISLILKDNYTFSGFPFLSFTAR